MNAKGKALNKKSKNITQAEMHLGNAKVAKARGDKPMEKYHKGNYKVEMNRNK